MTVDVHITTCHHHTVRCRPRVCQISDSNTREWTPEERLEISKYTVDSVKRFCQAIPPEQLSRLSLLDDGSDYAPAIEWLNGLTDINVVRYPHRGSSAGINDYCETIEADLVLHVEDDHILFNPFGKNWAQICYDFLTSDVAKQHNIKVITLRSGLPSEDTSPGLGGAWGPQGWVPGGILYKCMGNAHHIMLREDYKKFFPLSGSSGACETMMNGKLAQLGFKNVELQDFFYAFHSHMWEYPLIEGITSEELNRSGDGFEYGIKDMHEHFVKKGPIYVSRWLDYPSKERERYLIEKDYIY